MATNHFTEEDLAVAGVMVDPDGNTTFFKDKESPDESWSLTQLAVFIRKADQTAIGFGRAEAVERYYQGLAVHVAHKKCKEARRKWVEWCNRNHINRMTANRVERLYVAAQGAWAEQAVNKISLHTITDLYVMFGILKKQTTDIDHADNEVPSESNDGDQAASERSPADLDDSPSVIRVHTQDEDEESEMDDGEENSIDPPDEEDDGAGLGEEADERPVLGVDEIVMREDLEADPNQFLTSIRVRLGLVLASLNTIRLDPNQARVNLAVIIEVADAIERSIEDEDALSRINPSLAESAS
jgi:hypothetical protein